MGLLSHPLGPRHLPDSATHPGVDAVGLTRWVWNGRERLREKAPRVRRTASAEPPENAPSRQTDIFATDPDSA